MSKTKAQMIETIKGFFDQYNKFASIIPFKEYPIPDQDDLMEYHKDTIIECYDWVTGISEKYIWIRTRQYWLQQSHERWLSYTRMWGDPTEFTDYNELKVLVKELKAAIGWAHRPRALLLKNVERFKKKAKGKDDV
jgi:hypothetical protein